MESKEAIAIIREMIQQRCQQDREFEALSLALETLIPELKDGNAMKKDCVDSNHWSGGDDMMLESILLDINQQNAPLTYRQLVTDIANAIPKDVTIRRWKPSEEQMENFGFMLKYVAMDCNVKASLKSLYEQLMQL